jgi:hypothetical protein
MGDLMVNEELLRLGLAPVATFPPDVKYVDRSTKAIEKEAGPFYLGLSVRLKADTMSRN